MARETSSEAELLARARAFLSRSSFADRVASVHPMPGDASDRRYLRVGLTGGESIVLAVHPGPIEFDALPFVLVARMLRQFPVPVPALLAQSDTSGILALEDLGDTTLQAHLRTASEHERLARYREAVEIIHRLQARGASVEFEEYPPYGLAFDLEKLTLELDFFVEHFLNAHRQVRLDARQAAVLGEEWHHIAAELATEPRVLCHRDFHSRNLMVHKGRLHVIDFQDARLGPDTYDLASLLRDSYVDLDEGCRGALIAHFQSLKGVRDQEAFRRRFDVMSVQRNLKALGTFGYQAISRGRTSYLDDVPRTLGHLRVNLHRHARFNRLLGVLADHLPELR